MRWTAPHAGLMLYLRLVITDNLWLVALKSCPCVMFCSSAAVSDEFDEVTHDIPSNSRVSSPQTATIHLSHIYQAISVTSTKQIPTHIIHVQARHATRQNAATASPHCHTRQLPTHSKIHYTVKFMSTARLTALVSLLLKRHAQAEGGVPGTGVPSAPLWSPIKRSATRLRHQW